MLDRLLENALASLAYLWNGVLMKKDLMEILACPVCKGELELRSESEEGDDVVTGSLFCAACNETYPIEESIPNLLPPDLRRELG